MLTVCTSSFPAQSAAAAQRADVSPTGAASLANGVTWPQLTHTERPYLEEARRALPPTAGATPTRHRTPHRGTPQGDPPAQPDAGPAAARSVAGIAGVSPAGWLIRSSVRQMAACHPCRATATVSFELLARSVSRDIHPRTILDELLRLASVSQQADERLLPSADAFRPRSGLAERLQHAGGKCRDHLAAGAQPAAPDSPLLEQAFLPIVASGFGGSARQRAVQIWQHHFAALVAEAAALCEIDEPRGGAAADKVRRVFYRNRWTTCGAIGAPAAHHGKESKMKIKMVTYRDIGGTFAVAGVMQGCNGGGSDGGTVNTSSANGWDQGSGYATGTVTGFGSV